MYNNRTLCRWWSNSSGDNASIELVSHPPSSLGKKKTIDTVILSNSVSLVLFPPLQPLCSFTCLFSRLSTCLASPLTHWHVDIGGLQSWGWMWEEKSLFLFGGQCMQCNACKWSQVLLFSNTFQQSEIVLPTPGTSLCCQISDMMSVCVSLEMSPLSSLTLLASRRPEILFHL